MTRLETKDIRDIGRNLEAYDAELRNKCGQTLLGLACHAIGAEKGLIQQRLASLSAAVIPMTCGQGSLPGFSEAVEAIAAHLGCRALVTGLSDVGGLGEAFGNKSDVLLLADEDRYLALGIEKRLTVDNDRATARGFVAGLDLMARGVAGKNCLVIGCGPVGLEAAAALNERGSLVTLFDRDQAKLLLGLEVLQKTCSQAIRPAPDLETALGENRLIFEATNSPGVIPARAVGPETFIAAPGMPLGLEAEGADRAGPRLLHDPLQIGTATMLVTIAHEQKNT
ncbi:MAG: 3-methylornithyl-N6-L-lysine dehydrogenase PylD [Desulfohalobiaceae bacterium]|nr:3-methylornithyl-N6-L-lysine dehydrogenase PylD [Desulfohalobiaceae bacterium]